VNTYNEGDTPPLGMQYSGGDLDGTQYAKGRYAVRRNFVISYADINFYFKKAQFSSKNTTHMTYTVKTLNKMRACFARAFLGSIQQLET